jgi:hypothetical protein
MGLVNASLKCYKPRCQTYHFTCPGAKIVGVQYRWMFFNFNIAQISKMYHTRYPKLDLQYREIPKESIKYTGFGVLTAATMKSTTLWQVMPWSPVEVQQCFRGMYCFYLQGQRVSQASNQWAMLDICCLLVTCLTYSLLWRWRQYVYLEMSMNICQDYMAPIWGDISELIHVMPNMDCYKGKQKENQWMWNFWEALSEKLEGAETEVWIQNLLTRVRREIWLQWLGHVKRINRTKTLRRA